MDSDENYYSEREIYHLDEMTNGKEKEKIC